MTFPLLVQTGGISGSGQTFPNNVTNGTMLFLMVSGGYTTSGTVSDSSNGSYTQAVTSTNGTKTCTLFYVVNTVGGVKPTLTITGFSGANDYYSFEISGITTLDQTAAANSSGTTVSVGPISTGHPNEMIICGAWLNTSPSAAGAGYTCLSTGATNLFECQGVLSAGSYTATATCSSGAWVGIVASFYNTATQYSTQITNFAVTDFSSPSTPLATNLCPPLVSTENYQYNSGYAPAVVKAGDAIVVMVGIPTTATVTGVSDGTNTYVLCSGASVVDSSDSIQMVAYVAFNVAAGTTTNPVISVAYTGTAANANVNVFEISGVTAYDRGSGNASNGTNSSTPSSGSFTLAHSNEIVVAAVAQTGSTASAAGSGYTLIWIDTNFHGLMEFAPAVTGAQNATATLSGSAVWTMVAAGFYTPTTTPNQLVLPTDAVFFGMT